MEEFSTDLTLHVLSFAVFFPAVHYLNFFFSVAQCEESTGSIAAAKMQYLMADAEMGASLVFL